MPRVTHVKAARQRYEQITVTNEDGTPKKVQLMRKDGVTPKLTKRGAPIFITITKNDPTKPKPMPTCGYCHEPIRVGQAYKWIEPHGSRVLNRHEDCPTWNVWEYSSSLSARLAQIQHEAEVPDDLATEDDAQALLTEAAEAVRELAEEKRESAQNIEDGFQHATYQSDELNDQAEQLDQWADDIENASLPDFPEPEEEDCAECQGEGTIEEAEEPDRPCPECGGTGQVEAEEPNEDQIAAWLDEVRSAVDDVMANCPL